jgi:hypothetical protein
MGLNCTCGGTLRKEGGGRSVSKDQKFVCVECGKEGWYVERSDGKKLFIGCIG